jgi:hypothetical protein
MTNPEGNLEPRVAAIETQLGTLTSDVSDLVVAVRKQGEQMGALAIAIERSGAPKQANWFALIGTAISVTLLFITLGGLVLLPMAKEINRFEVWNEKHGDLELHPVGKTRIDALEKSVLERAAVNAAGIRELDVKLQKEYQLIDAGVRERVAAVERELRERWIIDSGGISKISDKTENILNRITVLETIAKQPKP